MHRFWRLISICLALGLIATTTARGEEPSSVKNEDELVRVVVLSRHGVRSPTQSPETLSAWSTRTWPQWPVQRGLLTRRGAVLTSAMWENLRLRFVRAGLNLTPEQVFVRADVDQRTQATARALLDGLHLPSTPFAVSTGKLDPLFHPVKAGKCAFDAQSVRDEVLRQAGGSLEHLTRELEEPLRRISDLVAPVSPALCQKWKLPPDCALADIPGVIEVRADEHAVNLQGGLAIASSLAEIFLLEYAEWPDKLSAWGQANEAVLRQILPVHNKIFDLVNRTPAVAGPRGSALLHEMAAALAGAHVDSRVNQARLTVFVGHDTNISNIGGLLGINWQLPEQGNSAIPPAGILALELRQKQAKQEIRIMFCAQSLRTMHGWTEADPLAEAAPICVPARLTSGEMALYTADAFSQLVQSAVRSQCVPEETELMRKQADL
ncbi:MAG: histidine-type phosphatase [Desulfovibrio sp.]|uniref:histidine-type phosphatase n=1 Tax=Desulfovibrio sp. TaxID=885 RepID=UPI0039E66B7E